MFQEISPLPLVCRNANGGKSRKDNKISERGVNDFRYICVDRIKL